MAAKERRIGVDTGGTFTDVFLEVGVLRRIVKVPSTPDDPARAVEAGLVALGEDATGARVVHGTTVGLNALLTRRLGRAALITNAGFRDLIEIGRQERPDIYALHPVKPAPVIPRNLRFEIEARSWPDPETGEVREVARPTDKQVRELAKRVAKTGVKSAAVCLLHSWATPDIETRIARALEQAIPGIAVTTSAGLAPVLREYERFTTATINAALVPITAGYIERLARTVARITGGELALLQSSGGAIGAARAAAEPARVLLSGPAGGVRGAARAASEAGLGDVVTLDMGGTSTDVAFACSATNDDAQMATAPPSVAGLPLVLPSLDIHTIGCGGGSLARVDAGGALHVGPKSAGADPGPVAYGRADVPTLTDAFVQLGRIQPGTFLGGELQLDTAAVHRAFDKLAAQLGLPKRGGADRAADAMIQIARAAMSRAVSAMTLQRGRDPRGLALVAFGGAGGLMAAELAAALGMPRVLIPRDPGVLSARGLASAGFEAEATRTVLWDLEHASSRDLEVLLAELGSDLEARSLEENVRWSTLSKSTHFQLRYRGQTFCLTLARGRSRSLGSLAKRFHAAHAHFFGHALVGHPIELVEVTLCASQKTRASSIQTPKRRPPTRAAHLGAARVRSAGSPCDAPVLDRAALAPGTAFSGPAVVVEYSSSTWIPPQVKARVTGAGHLLLELPKQVG